MDTMDTMDTEKTWRPTDNNLPSNDFPYRAQQPMQRVPVLPTPLPLSNMMDG